jgi:hypothetical protein
MSAISRIVLDADTRQTVDRIQRITKTTSPSAAISLMISRYAKHLLQTWELSADRCPEPSVEPYLSPASLSPVAPASAANDFQFSEAIDL